MVTFSQVALNVWIAETSVTITGVDGRSFSCPLSLRIDGRYAATSHGGRIYRVDRSGMCGWEAIDGGEDAAPRSFDDAVALACDYHTRVESQHTLTPLG